MGALVPELLLDARRTRMTNDADVTVIVESLADFETLKDPLAEYGFARRPAPQAIAVALALRHSWQPDDLNRLARRLRMQVS